MRYRLIGIFGFFLVLLPCEVSTAQSQIEKCDALPHIAVPQTDLPTPANASCNIPVSYLGFQSKADALSLYYSDIPGHFEKARYCAFSSIGLTRKEATPPAAPTEQGLEGSDALTLAMIYANGEGVPRDFQLARQFVCQDSDGTAGPTPDRMLHDFDNSIKEKGRFDACENGGAAYSREINTECLGIQEQQAIEEIQRREKLILVSGSPALKASFMALKAAYHTFQVEYFQMEGTACEGGTGCGAISEGYDVAVDKSWIVTLVAIQAGSPPCFGFKASEFGRLDADLNQQFKERLKDTYMDTSAGDNSQPLAPLVRATDRAWLKYRDAWVSYGQLRWPSIPADQWRAWQTKEWINLLTM